MAKPLPDDTEHPSSISITVLSVKPVKFGRIFASGSSRSTPCRLSSTGFAQIALSQWVRVLASDLPAYLG
jgi:hypothetical protein